MSSGVPTRCPLAGLLFILAFDPCVRWLANCVPTIAPDMPCCLAACADDIAVVIARLGLLKRFADRMSQVTDASGLHWHPNKCVIVPLGHLSGHSNAPGPDMVRLRRMIAFLAPALANDDFHVARVIS